MFVLCCSRVWTKRWYASQGTWERHDRAQAESSQGWAWRRLPRTRTCASTSVGCTCATPLICYATSPTAQHRPSPASSTVTDSLLDRSTVACAPRPAPPVQDTFACQRVHRRSPLSLDSKPIRIHATSHTTPQPWLGQETMTSL